MDDVRLIDANKLKELLVMYLAEHIRFPDKDRTTTFVGVLDWVDSAPTIEAEPVRHGRWVWTQNGWCCSVCYKKSMVEAVAFAKYCHRCGAKMDGKEG